MPVDLSQIRGVIFDLDGTLVESYAAHIESWIRAVASLGITVTEKDVRPHMGRSSLDISRALLGGRCDSDTEGASRLKDEIYYQIIPEVLEPIDGALDTLAELKRRGYLISVASSNPVHVISRSLEAVRLDALADSVASQDEVERGKPEPDLFLLAQRKLGLSSGACMAVGDTCFDVLAAKAAGMSTAAFSGGCQTEDELGQSQPDFLVGDLRQLVEILPEEACQI